MQTASAAAPLQPVQAGGMQVQQAIIIPASQAGNYNAYNDNKTRPNYAAKCAIILGGLQICIAALCVLFQIVLISIGSDFGAVAQGFWCGFWYFISGALGLSSGKSKSTCSIIGCMVMNIISAMFCLGLLVCSAIGLGIANDPYNHHYYGSCDPDSYDYRPDNDCDIREAEKGLYGVMIILALFEVVVSIWASALCCNAVCCTTNHNLQGMVLNGNVQYTPGNQQVLIIQQPVAGVAGTVGAQPTVVQGFPQQQPAYNPAMPPAYSAAEAPPPTYGAPGVVHQVPQKS